MRSLNILLGSYNTLLRYVSFHRPKTGSPNKRYALMTEPKKKTFRLIGIHTKLPNLCNKTSKILNIVF